MSRRIGPVAWFYRKRSAWRRRHRLWFPSPAEVQLVRIMGGRAIVIDPIRAHHTNFPLTFVVSMGIVFKQEHVKREVRVGKHYVDFGNDIRRAIEVDGRPFHGDILREQERNNYCAQYGWILLHITAADLYQRPNEVHRKVIAFLLK